MQTPNHQDGTPSIHAFAQRLGLGESDKMCCPWCSATRRKHEEKCLTVTIDGRGYLAYCHHCNQTEKFLEGQRRRWTPIERYPIKYERGDPAIIARWFALRGISQATLDAYQVGSGRARGMRFFDLDDHAVTYPIFDDDGTVGNIKYRAAPEKEFRQIKNPLPGFFGRQFLKGGTGSVYLTEGEGDALSLFECGFAPAVSVPNGAIEKPTKIETAKFAYLDHDMPLLASYDRIYLLTDGDQPGTNLRVELAQRLGKARCYTVTYPEGCKDSNDVLVKYGKDGIHDLITNAKPIPIEGLGDFGDILDEAWSDATGERDWGFSTGYEELNHLLRIRPGELTTVTGRPTAGKSTFVNQLCTNLAEYEQCRIAIASFEQLEVRLFNELISKIARHAVHGGRMSHEDWEIHADYVRGRFCPLRFGNAAPTSDLIFEAADAAVRRYGINVLVIDGYSNVQASGSSEPRERVQAFLSRAASWAKKNGVAVFLIAHPRKMNGDQIPTAYDISESAHWFNLNDNIIVVDRPNDAPGYTDIYIEKNRLMGYTGSVRLAFDRPSTTYTDSLY